MSNDFQAHGERDSMMYDEKPSFKSYYKSRLFPAKDYQDVTICEETGIVFAEKRYRLYRVFGILLTLGFTFLITYSGVMGNSEQSVLEELRFAEIALWMGMVSLVFRYISPLRYFFVQFNMEQSKDRIEVLEEATRVARTAMPRTIVIYILSSVAVILALIFVMLWRQQEISVEAADEAITIIAFAGLIFLITTTVNVCFWRDTKRCINEQGTSNDILKH